MTADQPRDRGTMHTGTLHQIDQRPWTGMSYATKETKKET